MSSGPARPRLDSVLSRIFDWLDRGLPLRRVRPLASVSSLKIKFTIVLAAAVMVTAIGVSAGHSLGIPTPWTMAAALVVAVVVVQILARGITAPLREMIDATQAMSGGDYGRQVAADSADEVGRLARSFNTMSANLADLERQRDDLIANVGHELRTPVAVLHASLENLLDDVVHDQRSTLETMLRQVERLGRLVAELLELSRLEGGIVSLRPGRIDLAELVRAAVAEARLRTPPPDIEMIVPQGVFVDGDQQRLESVVANLIDNAVRHGGLGPVSIVVSSTAGTISVSVTDHGPGVPSEDIDRIFDRFYRSDGSSDGLGLGLAIASWVADLHGGTIAARNVEPTGLEVTLSLPSGAR